MQVTAEQLREHEHALRVLAGQIAQQTAVARLAVPVLWGMDELRAHYPALSKAQITALLEHHCGYRGARGHSIAVHVDQVLKLDAVLAGRGEVAHAH